MKTRILVSGSTLALALAALPAWAGLRVTEAPVASPAAQAVPPNNYQEFGSSPAQSSPAVLAGDKLAGDKVQPAIRRWQPTATSAPAAFPSYVTQSGTSDASASATAAAGTDVLLSDALSRILPSGFTLVDNQVPMRKLASWTGARSWLDILADLGRAANFVAHVDWDRRQVSLAPAPASLVAKQTSQSPATASPAVKEVREIREVQTLGTARPAMKPLPPMSAPLPPAVSSWSLDPTLTLQENVRAWAQKAGWTVVWDAVDYPVCAKTSFQGDFSASGGPLAQVFAGYADSDQPLLVRLTSRDRVVYVRNRMLDRAEVSPLPEPMADGSF